MQQTMLPLGNLSGAIRTSSSLSEMESAAYVWTASFPLYVTASFIFFVGSLVLFFLPLNSRSSNASELKTPLTPSSAHTEEAEEVLPESTSASDTDTSLDDSPIRKFFSDREADLWNDTTKNLGSTRLD
jgi:hypothetical protein